MVVKSCEICYFVMVERQKFCSRNSINSKFSLSHEKLFSLSAHCLCAGSYFISVIHEASSGGKTVGILFPLLSVYS